MKISKLFHWLYFTVMMLPIFIIPIFAIFTRNENYSSNIELQVEENRVVDFNQLILNGLPSSIDGYSTIDSNVLSYEANNIKVTYGGVNNRYYVVDYYYNNDLIPNNIYCIKATYNSSQQIDNIRIRDTNNNEYAYFGNVSSTQSISYLLSNITFNGRFRFIFNFGGTIDSPILYFKDFQLFNLTQMFGAGNEPSLQQFNNWYSNDYYDYTLSDIQLLKGYDTLTYNDSDVASQYLYIMYNGVDKYFNYDKVFNFGSLYDWLQLTFFDGNAPLGFFIFWHLLIYWLLTSLLWLLFDVLMYVPNLIHRWLDKASLS